MILLALCIKTKSIWLNGNERTIRYNYDTLLSGKKMSFKMPSNYAYYFLALTAEQNVEACNIEVAVTGINTFAGIVFQAKKVVFRLSDIIFYQMSPNTQVYYVYQSEETLLYHANISFISDSQQLIGPTFVANTTLITNATSRLIINNQVAGKLSTPPCASCVHADQELSKNCFGCPFGQKNNGNDVCVCEYDDSTMNNNNICEHIYEDTINSGGNHYFSDCKSNTQLTIEYDRYIYDTQVSVFKDDSCGIVNVLVEGSMTIGGGVEYISGLVRYSTRNIQYVYSSLNLWVKSSATLLSLISNEASADVELKGITLNGRLNGTVYGSTLSWAAGVLVYVPAERTVTVTAVRVLGLDIFVNGYYHVSFVVGRNQGSVAISDVLILPFNHLNLTGTPVSAAGIDLNQISFPCKSSAVSEDLKDSIKLRQLVQQYNNTGKQTNMLYNLQQSGGVIGCNVNATAVISNVALSAFVNASIHSSSGTRNVGLLVGLSENSTLTATRVYCDGKAVAYRNIGVVGAVNNGNATLVGATNCYLDGDQYAGFIGSSSYGQISAKIAVDVEVDSYCYRSSLFGTSNGTTFSVAEAIGKVLFKGQQCATYLADCNSATFNGITCSGNGKLADVADLLVNECQV